ncbi:hypothetical protein C2E21_9235 [Chlorella sorokiniana]|uniref:Uncharacterized protein n=1 Tax=Chlorella sorokiniana TaxID=3076 RepID=A0A2P6TC27_CHLSO|nr:hypothetical protein C2E21_9235 [Chlorella sorokiniana]|eukprot:PRW20190.1 hypothetical protein C2E21_9235 [Chlorella sorokiniana]
MADPHLPIDVLRLVLQELIGDEPQEAYRLCRHLQAFSLVCRSWREAAATTPLRVNLAYLTDLPWPALRWLQRMTIADLDVHPNVPVNRVLTHPDFAARNKWVLERLWGAQLPGAPGRWPQFKHFPRLQILELTCDQQSMGEGSDPQHFESRIVASLTELRHLSLQRFGSADFSRLPLSLEVLQADLYMALPLALPPALRLQELDVSAARMLVDWDQLCSQVERVIVMEACQIDVLARRGGASLCRQTAAGFIEGCVAEVELIAEEVALVMLPAGFLDDGRQALPRPMTEQQYQPEVEEAVHLVTLAADYQQHHFRAFSAVYNPDDLQANDDLGMADGITVRLHRPQPDEPRVLGFCYSLQEDQLAFLLTEATVQGLHLEAFDEPDQVLQVLNDEEFKRRNAPCLRSLAGLDLLDSLDLQDYGALQRFEGYLQNNPDSLGAVSQLPRGLTFLDLCGTPPQDFDPAVESTDPAAWPSFPTAVSSCLSQLTALQELSLRHFREVELDGVLPASVEMLNLECLKPRPPPAQPWYARFAGGRASPADTFSFTLPALQPGQQRTLNLQFHRSQDYRVSRPTLFLRQFLHAATRLVITVGADPMTDEEALEASEEELEAAAQRGTLVLAAEHESLREALDALTASQLQMIDLEADEVLFTDDAGASFTGSRRVQQFIRQAYRDEWLCWSHEPEFGEDGEAEEEEAGGQLRHAGGFTLRRNAAAATNPRFQDGAATEAGSWQGPACWSIVEAESSLAAAGCNAVSTAGTFLPLAQQQWQRAAAGAVVLPWQVDSGLSGSWVAAATVTTAAALVISQQAVLPIAAAAAPDLAQLNSDADRLLAQLASLGEDIRNLRMLACSAPPSGAPPSVLSISSSSSWTTTCPALWL